MSERALPKNGRAHLLRDLLCELISETEMRGKFARFAEARHEMDVPETFSLFKPGWRQFPSSKESTLCDIRGLSDCACSAASPDDFALC